MSPFKDLKTFQVTIRHDSGKIRIKTAATDKDHAKNIICQAEGCPETAILKVIELIPKAAYSARNTY